MMHFITNNDISIFNDYKQLAIIKFSATWCTPCKILDKIIEDVFLEHKTNVLIITCDIDENQDVTKQFNVRSVPTLLFFKNDKEVDRIIGLTSKDKIIQKIQEHV